MSLGQYLLSVALVVLLVAPLAIAAGAVRRRLAPGLAGAPAALAQIVVTLALLVVLGEALGAVGAFDVWVLVPTALAMSVALTLVLGRKGRGGSPPAAAREPESWRRPTTLVSLTGAVLVFAHWGAGTVSALRYGMAAPDTVWYHMPFAARFAQDGWLTRLHFVEFEPLTAFFPANAELVHAYGLELFAQHDVLSPFLNLGFLALALLAGWCIGRPWGVSGPSLLATSLALSWPMLWGINAGQAGNDVVGVALFLAAAALLVTGRGGRGVYVLAGAAAGLAVGTKLALLAPVAALTIAAVAIAPRGRRLAGTGVWVAAALATGGFWYLRNLVRTGSPLPFADVTIGPLHLPSPPRGLTENLEFSVAHYIGDPEIWASHFLPGLDQAFGSAWWAVLALAAAGAVGAAIAPGDPRRRVLGLVAVACAAAYLITPNGAAGREGDPWAFGLNLRYAAAAMALGLALLPTWAARASARGRGALMAALGITLLATLLTNPALWPGRGADTLAIIATAVFVALLAVWLRAPERRRYVLPVALGAAAALVAAGWFVQRDYELNRYGGQLVLLGSANEVRNSRIGIMGPLIHYPVLGPDLSNRVEYVGHHGPHGAFTRLGDCTRWRQALNAGRYRYVVVGGVVSPNLPASRPPRPPELDWTRSDPAASVVSQDVDSAAFRIDGRMDPAGCASSRISPDLARSPRPRASETRARARLPLRP